MIILMKYDVIKRGQFNKISDMNGNTRKFQTAEQSLQPLNLWKFVALTWRRTAIVCFVSFCKHEEK